MILKILIGLIFLSNSAFAADIIYTWGYGRVYNDILLGIADVIGQANKTLLVAAAVGFLFLVYRIITDPKSNPVIDVVKWLFLSMFIIGWFLSPVPGQNTYNISDQVTGNAYTVSGIPPGIGKTLSFFSGIERALASGMSSHFSTPNSLQYANSGFGFAMTGYEAISSSTTTDPYLQLTFTDYMSNCLLLALSENSISASNVFESSNLINAIKVEDDSRVSVIYSAANPNGTLATCTNVYNDIATRIGNDVDNIYNISETFLGTMGTDSPNNLLKDGAPDISLLMSGSSMNASALMIQSTLSNMMTKSFYSVAKVSGVDPTALAYGTALADRTQTMNFLTQGQLSKKWLPIIKGGVTIIFLGISWILAILSIAHFNMKYIFLFFSINLWLLLWTPILVILNYFVNIELESMGSGLVSTAGVFSLSNKASIDQNVIETLSWVSSAYILVPVIAMGIAKASDYGFTAIAGSLTNGISGAASGSSGESAKGSYSFGQTSIGNQDIWSKDGHLTRNTFGSLSKTSGKRVGNTPVEETTYSTKDGENILNSNGAGISLATNNGKVINASGVNATTKKSVNETLSQNIAQEQAKAKTAKESLSSVADNMNQWSNSTSNNNSDSETSAVSAKEQERVEQIEEAAFAKYFDENNNVRETVAKSIGLESGASGMDISKKLISKAKANRTSLSNALKASLNKTDSENHVLTEQIKEGYSKNFRDMVSKDLSSDETLQSVAQKTESEDEKKTHGEGTKWIKDASESYNQALKKADNYQKQLNSSESISVNNDTAFSQWVMDKKTNSEPSKAVDWINEKRQNETLDDAYMEFLQFQANKESGTENSKLAGYDVGNLQPDKDEKGQIIPGTDKEFKMNGLKDVQQLNETSTSMSNKNDEIIKESDNSMKNGKDKTTKSTYDNNNHHNIKEPNTDRNSFKEEHKPQSQMPNQGSGEIENKVNNALKEGTLSENFSTLVEATSGLAVASLFSDINGQNKNIDSDNKLEKMENDRESLKDDSKAHATKKMDAKLDEIIDNKKSTPEQVSNAKVAKQELAEHGSISGKTLKDTGIDLKGLEKEGFVVNELGTDMEQSGKNMESNIDEKIKEHKKSDFNKTIDEAKKAHPEIDPDGKKGVWKKVKSMGSDMIDGFSPKDLKKATVPALATIAASAVLEEIDHPLAKATVEAMSTVGDAVNTMIDSGVDVAIVAGAKMFGDKHYQDAAMNNLLKNWAEESVEIGNHMDGVVDNVKKII